MDVNASSSNSVYFRHNLDVTISNNLVHGVMKAFALMNGVSKRLDDAT